MNSNINKKKKLYNEKVNKKWFKGSVEVLKNIKMVPYIKVNSNARNAMEKV